MSDIYQIDMPPSRDRKGFCANVVVENGAVIECAPIVKWTRGKPWQRVRQYYTERKATIRQATPAATPETVTAPPSPPVQQFVPDGCEARPAEKVMPAASELPPVSEAMRRCAVMAEKAKQDEASNPAWFDGHEDFRRRYPHTGKLPQADWFELPDADLPPGVTAERLRQIVDSTVAEGRLRD